MILSSRLRTIDDSKFWSCCSFATTSLFVIRCCSFSFSRRFNLIFTFFVIKVSKYFSTSMTSIDSCLTREDSEELKLVKSMITRFFESTLERRVWERRVIVEDCCTFNEALIKLKKRRRASRYAKIEASMIDSKKSDDALTKDCCSALVKNCSVFEVSLYSKKRREILAKDCSVLEISLYSKRRRETLAKVCSVFEVSLYSKKRRETLVEDCDVNEDLRS